MGKKRKDEELAERLLDFAVRMIKLCGELPRTTVGNHIRGQFIKCGTSPGANYEEARGAESSADFLHKLGVVLKELKESRFWLNVILKARLLRPEKVVPLRDQCEELIAIIAKSIFTAKKSRK